MDNMVYLDNSATTPLCEAAREAVCNAMEHYGNPSSLHTLGQQSEKLVRVAREQLLSALGVRRGQGTVVFTSCGTEATSLAIFGCAYAKTRRDATRILTTDSEHPATAQALSALEGDGFEIVRIPTRGGVLDMEAVSAALDKKIFMATFMLVNNETGALYSVKEAFARIKRRYPDAITHCDAIQGFMRVSFTPSAIGAELVSVSGHKIHAPKGVGALYISAEMIKKKKIIPFLNGGGQEKGWRSGTENTIGIAALGAAAEDMRIRLGEISSHIAELYEYASEKLEAMGIRINRPADRYVRNIINITIPNIKSETVLHFLSADGVFISSGSACSAHSHTTSSALLAFGLCAADADCSLRVSLSEYNTKEDIDTLCTSLSGAMSRLVRIKR